MESISSIPATRCVRGDVGNNSCGNSHSLLLPKKTSSWFSWLTNPTPPKTSVICSGVCSCGRWTWREMRIFCRASCAVDGLLATATIFGKKNKWKNTWNNRRPGKRHIYILSYLCSKPLFKLYIFNKSQTKTGLVHFSFAHVFQLVEWGVWITVFDIPNGSCAFNLGNDSSTGWKMATPCWQWYLFKSKILDGCKIKWETGNCKHILAYTIRIENWSLTFLNYIANRWELQKAVCLGSFVERTWTCTTHFCHSIVNLLGGNSLCSKIPEQAII